MLSRRSFLRKTLQWLHNEPLTGEKLVIKPRSVVWKFGPPGHPLSKFIKELGEYVCPPTWEYPEDSDYDLWKYVTMERTYSPEHLIWVEYEQQATKKIFVFDDEPLRDDPWTTAEERLERFAWWASVKLILK